MPLFRLLIAILFIGVFNELSAQQFHTNVIVVDSCANYLVVNDPLPAGFAESGVFFFVHQHRGAQISTEDNADFGTLTDLNGVGRYELNRIATVIGDTIFAQFKLRHDYLTDDFATSITLSPPQDAAINQDITATPFNGQNGGVLLLGSDNTLFINANLSANGAGYAGGAAEIWDSQCGVLTSANDYFYDPSNWRGAYKGEGATLPAVLVGKETGRGPNLNGGGGGNDHNSGGGGGGHITAGGNGASNQEPGIFNCRGNFPGLGGRALPHTQNGSQRIYFGGGGGAGHGNNNNPTAGGNGGGIIVLSAPQILFGNNPNINVSGQSAELVDGDGGGGGGAAGSILLFSEDVSPDVTFSFNGGDGGSVTNNGQNRCFGPGGGGSGGRFLYAGPPVTDWTLELDGGNGGESINSQACGPGENVADSGITGIAEAAIQWPISISTALDYPDTTVIAAASCVGGSLQIGRPNDLSCFAAQWFILTPPNDFESLAGNPDYGPTNGPDLDILNLPPPSFGDFVIYRLERYGRNGQVIASLNINVPIVATVSADFSFVADQLNVDFTGLVSGGNDIQWFFGDGNSSQIQNPQHNYAASGTYEVTLIVNGACGADTSIQQITVAASAPVAIIGGQTNAICLGDTLKLYNLSENSTEIEWTAADFFIIPNNQADTVCLVAQNTGDLTIGLCANNIDQQDCSEFTISVSPPPSFTLSDLSSGTTLSVMAGDLVATDFYWLSPSGDTIFDAAYSLADLPAGDYSTIFFASNGACQTISDTLNITILEPTEPKIGLLFPQGCSPFTAQFFNETNGPVDSILWTNEVAMPFASGADTLTLVFTDAGVFTVTLTVYSPNGTFTETAEIEVLPSPEVDFTLVELDGLLSTTNLSQNATSYQWNFGDGNSSTEFEPQHLYTTIGTYEVTLNAFNAACNRAISETIFVDMINNIQELAALGIELYPNPVRETLYINGELSGWQLFDFQGQLISSSKEASTQQINMALLPSGTYLLRLKTNEKSLSTTIIKQ